MAIDAFYVNFFDGFSGTRPNKEKGAPEAKTMRKHNY